MYNKYNTIFTSSQEPLLRYLPANVKIASGEWGKVEFWLKIQFFNYCRLEKKVMTVYS